MRKLIVLFAFVLTTSAFSSNGIKNVERNLIKKSNQENVLSVLNQSKSIKTFDVSSCTIETRTQITMNGEVIYQSTVLFHIDGYTCDEFFGMIASAFM